MYSTASLLRVVKTVSVAAIGIQSLLIELGNITDYTTNYRFVEHVLNMDTTFSNTTIHTRSLNNPVIFSNQLRADYRAGSIDERLLPVGKLVVSKTPKQRSRHVSSG